MVLFTSLWNILCPLNLWFFLHHWKNYYVVFGQLCVKQLKKCLMRMSAVKLWSVKFLRPGFCNLVPQAFPLNSWGKFGTWSESGIWALSWQLNGGSWSHALVDVFANLWCMQRVGAGRMALSRGTAGLPSPGMVQHSTAGGQVGCHTSLTWLCTQNIFWVTFWECRCYFRFCEKEFLFSASFSSSSFCALGVLVVLFECLMSSSFLSYILMDVPVSNLSF